MTFSRNARTLACVGNQSSSLKVRQVAIGHGHLLAVTILIGSDRSTTLCLPLASLPRHPVAARLVVGPDDVRDVGVDNERYDAVTPSGSGVGSEVDGGHCKSSCRPRFRLRASAAGRPQEPLYAHSAPVSDEPVRRSVSAGARSPRLVGVLLSGSVGTPEWLHEPAEALVIRYDVPVCRNGEFLFR